MAEIPEAEFRRWYPVPAAVERLRERGFDTEAARKAILDGLTSDEIQGAAERILKLSTVGGKNEDLPCATLRSAHWSRDTISESFWDSGKTILRKAKVPDFVYHCTGVRFRPADIDKLAAQKRPSVEHATERTWIAAQDAYVLAAVPYHDNLAAQAAIISHAAAGLITARCRRRTIRKFDNAAAQTSTQDGVVVAADFWQAFETGSNARVADWHSGIFGTLQYLNNGWFEVRHLGVRFCEQELREHIPGIDTTPEVAPEPWRRAELLAAADEAARLAREDPPEKHLEISRAPPPITPLSGHSYATPAAPEPPARIASRRGPKPKSFWGDAMSAVEASISGGELLASSLADVERAMLEWIISQGWDAGESTIRNYAKPIWERARRRGQ